MINYFFWGTIILFVATLIFYLVFVSLLYYWHEKNTTYVILPLIFTFEFFITAFLVVSAIELVLYYLPDILKLASLA